MFLNYVDPLIELFNWDKLADLNIFTVLFRLFLAVLCGGILGFERATKHHAAGFRTYILVCLGSTIAMLTNEFLTLSTNTGDPARLGAQVISGIGFLGAGTILITSRNQIKGLTTAAGLWGCACLGLSIGVGFYTVAIFGALFIFVAIYAAISIYNNTRPIALGYALINSSDPDHLNQAVIDKYMDCYGFDSGYQIMDDKEVRMSYEEYEQLASQGNMDNNTDYSQFPLLCWNGYYDIIFTDKAGLEYCSRESVIEPLENAFTKDLNDIIYGSYSDLFIESPDYEGKSVDYAIDVSDCQKIKELNLGLEEVYICFPASTPQNDDRDRNLSNRKRFLKFIFDLDIEI